MVKRVVQAFCGQGKGKTSAAVGQCIRAASLGKSTIIIQFLKGKDAEELSFMEKLEPQIKLFRFARSLQNYCDLPDIEKEDEKHNLINGFNFAKKVIETGECDVLVLDEVLGLVDLGIISKDDLLQLIQARDDYDRLVLTGYHLPEELIPYVDVISEIQLIKDNT